MHVILPLLLGVLSILRRRVSSGLHMTLVHFYQVHVPNTSHKDLEQIVLNDGGTHELMVFQEFFEGHRSVRLEALSHIVVGTEQIEEFISAFLNTLLS